MSLYNAVFGESPLSQALLPMLGLTQGDFGRYRDCGIEPGRIYVYTRCGGGNREDYPQVFKTMYNHPLYIEDCDNDFDCTYCTFYFKFPEEYAEDLNKAAEGVEKWNPSERWTKMIDAIKGMTPSAAEKPAIGGR